MEDHTSLSHDTRDIITFIRRLLETLKCNVLGFWTRRSVDQAEHSDNNDAERAPPP